VSDLLREIVCRIHLAYLGASVLLSVAVTIGVFVVFGPRVALFTSVPTGLFIGMAGYWLGEYRADRSTR
jgi:uncharacterized membrane protein YraQ (UPF0718 family)